MLVQEVMAAMTTLPCLQRIFHRSGNMLMNLRIFNADRGRTAAFLLPLRTVRMRWSCRCRSLGRLRLDQRRQRLVERLSCLRQDNAILRTLRPGQARLDGRKIKREQLGVFRLRSLVVVEQSLLAAVSFDQRDLLFGTSREPQVAKSLFINRENSASRSVLGRHVGNGGAIGQRQDPAAQARSTRQTFRPRRASATFR